MKEAGGIDEALGLEHERSDAGAGLTGADAVALAAALEQARHDPELSRNVSEYVGRQRHLVDLQLRYFDEERHLAIAAAKRKRLSDRLRNGLQLLLAVIATGAVVGFAAMALDASQDHGLVVEAFSVPPDLAARGLTGQVVAKQILDRLSDFQAQTLSMRAASSYRNNWGDDIKVEIPETGVSLGELRRFLHESLGHTTHISGEVFRSGTQLTVTARVGEDSGKSFSAEDSGLDRLIQQAAEAVYERTQPYRYAVYADREQLTVQGEAVIERALHDAVPVERAWAHVHLGVSAMGRNDDAGAAAHLRAAVREVPAFAPALWNLVYAEGDLGHDQEAARQAAQFMAATRSLRVDIAAEQRDAIRLDTLWLKEELEGDYGDAARIARELADAATQAIRDDSRSDLPRSLVFDHDLNGAHAAIAQMAPEDPGRFLIPGLAALELGDPTAVALLGRAADAHAAWPADNVHDYLRTPVAPWLAIAKARFGDPAGAQAVIAATPADCYLCLRARGQIAALAGHCAAAERWFAEAIKQGPELPQAWVDRGHAHLVWGDAAGALKDAQQAARVSPHHADAWKLWGDALASQSQWSEALANYEEALKDAPDWGALKQARDTASAHGA